MTLFDSHCHIQDPRFDGIRDEVFARALEAGVSGCMTCGTIPGDWDAVAALEPPGGFTIKRAFGVHPWFADDLPDSWREDLKKRLLHFHDAWIGEIGLDAIRKPAKAARDILRQQLALAAEMERPVALHGAKALDELLAECRPFAKAIPLFMVHAFSGSSEQLKRWLDFGAKISFGGAVIASARLCKLAATVPEDRLLVETDAPDMLPRGAPPAKPGTQLNDLANLAIVANAIQKMREGACATEGKES